MTKRLLSLEFKIGLFIIIGVVIFLFFVFSQGKIMRGRAYNVNVLFNNVAGLDTGASVRVSGLQVGEVTNLKIVYVRGNGVEQPRILVSLQLNPNVKLGRHSVFTIRSLGLIGEKYVEIMPTGLYDTPLIQPGETVSGVTPLSVEKLLATSEDIMKNLDSVLVSLNRVVGNKQFADSLADLGPNINSFLKKTSTAMEKFGSLAGSFAATSRDMNNILLENRANVHLLLADSDKMVRDVSKFTENASGDLSNITGSFENTAGSLQSLIAGLESDNGLLNRATASVEELQRASAAITADAQKIGVLSDRLNATAKYVNEGKGNLGKLIYDQQLYDTLLNFATEIKKHPGQLFWNR